MKTEHRLFFAIPYDSATKNLYDLVCCNIRERYPSVTTVIGIQEVGPSPEYSQIATFKAQNRELTKQFVDQIQKSDIVIADLTHNNPNVHVELGIALMQNKNILRVTGRSLSELGFDIRNLGVYQYENEEQLTKKIIGYLETFFKIKQLPISEDYKELYCKEPTPLKLRAKEKKIDVQSNCPSDFMMRDGAIQANFEILSAKSSEDWFGICFRAGSNPFMSSHLVYVRQNGNIEIAIYPGPHLLNVLETRQMITGRSILTVEFENDYCNVEIDRHQLTSYELSYQAIGRVFQAAWCADVDVHSVEMICRDTLE
jgi:nucleoside 2-deoxyribosyltransferase